MTASDILRIAKREIGVEESPAGSNKVKYNTWYYGREVSGGAYPWCMTFVQWLFNEAGNPLGKKTASCNALINWLKPQGKYKTSNYKRGDIVFMDFNGKGVTHVGILEEIKDGNFITIEGNTSVTSDDNGGKVMRRTRKPSVVAGAGIPDYESEDDMTGEEIYNALMEYLSSQELPEWAKAELKEAIALGITDGENPMVFTPRYQTAIMTKRAVKGE